MSTPPPVTANLSFIDSSNAIVIGSGNCNNITSWAWNSGTHVDISIAPNSVVNTTPPYTGTSIAIDWTGPYSNASIWNPVQNYSSAVTFATTYP